MSLTFSKGHRVMEKKLCYHSVVKLHEATQIIVMVDYVRKVTSRKVL